MSANKVQKKWTDESVGRELQTLVRQHGILTAPLLEEHCPHMLNGIGKLGGAQAVCARLGIPYLPRRHHWSDEEIKLGLQRLSEQHGALCASLVKKQDRKLSDAISREFGTLKAACARFKVPYRGARFLWTREKLIEALKRREREGKTLNSRKVSKEHRVLLDVAARFYGSWRQALKEAGIDFNAHHFLDPHKPRPQLRKWGTESIREGLTAWAAEHGVLSSSGLVNSGHRSLERAAKTYLGSLQIACEKFGLPFKPGCQRWNLELIFKEIRKLGRQKCSLAIAEVNRHNPSLVKAVHKRGYTWEEMVESAGFSYKRYAKQRRWTPERLDYEFRCYYERHGVVNDAILRKEDSPLRLALRKRYGSLAQAARAFGFVYRRSLRSWTRESVVAQVLTRLREGRSIRNADVHAEDSAFYQAAIRHCGSWENAVRAAGFNYDSIRRKRQWTPEKIEMELRAWVASHGTLSYVKLRREHAYLAQAVWKHLGGLERAAKAFNLPFEKSKRD